MPSYHRTTRRVCFCTTAPFMKPDAPNRTRPDARNGRVRTRADGLVEFQPTVPERLLGGAVQELFRTRADGSVEFYATFPVFRRCSERNRH